MTLDEIWAIPKEHYPIFMYCDGGSLFGWLIRMVDKSAASHLQIYIAPQVIASQGLYFKTFPVSHLKGYNTKMIWNPAWTPEERKTMIDFINCRLALPWWKTLYDVPGVIGEALNWEWLQVKKWDFCSEAVARVLMLIDSSFALWLIDNPSPTPREFNLWTKAHNPPYEVYGRYSPDDEEKATDGTRARG